MSAPGSRHYRMLLPGGDSADWPTDAWSAVVPVVVCRVLVYQQSRR
jgi:hypothetical protein